jgi:hypothetical protein
VIPEGFAERLLPVVGGCYPSPRGCYPSPSFGPADLADAWLRGTDDLDAFEVPF